MIFKCKRCGFCCLTIIEFNVTKEDIYRWWREGRTDILFYVDFIYLEDGRLVSGREYKGEKIKKDRVSEFYCNGKERCPFVIKVRNKDIYECLIQDTKPEYCGKYECEPEKRRVWLKEKR